MKAHIVLPSSCSTTQVTIPICIPDRYAKAIMREAMRGQEMDEASECSDKTTNISGNTNTSMVIVRIARTLVSRYDALKNTVSYHSVPMSRVKIGDFMGKGQFIFADISEVNKVADLGKVSKVGIVWDMASDMAVRMIKEKALYVSKEETGAVLITATKEHLITASILERLSLDKETTAITIVIPADVVEKWPDDSINVMLKQYEQTVKDIKTEAREKFLDFLVDDSYALTVSGHTAVRGINRSLGESWDQFRILLEDPKGGIVTLRITSADPENFEEICTDGKVGTMFEVSGIVSDADDGSTKGTYLFVFNKK